jgi:opacity protein-like surface antigen
MAKRAMWLAAALLAAAPINVAAQSGPGLYLGASLGTHVEKGDRLTGNAPAVAVVGGVRLSPNWGVEMEVARPTRAFVRERVCRCVSFASTREDFDRFAITEQIRSERDVLSSISVGVVYEPGVSVRWSPRVFMGVTNHRVRESESYTVLDMPPGVDPERVAAMRPSSPTPFMRNIGGLAFGAGAVYRLTPHLSLGGDVRYDYGSIGDEINNVWRPSLRSTWSF